MYFSDIAYDKARKLRKDEDGKAGCALLFHYVGHGATVKQYTCMLLNKEYEDNCNPYPIEAKLRAFVSEQNSFVLGMINCCRKELTGSLSDGSFA